MSLETYWWLNHMVLFGNTEKRGNAWHYKASEQDGESNHYPGAIPIEDVRRRLFSWKAVEGDMQSTHWDKDADDSADKSQRELWVPRFTIVDAERLTMLRPPGAFGDDDQGAILGTFKDGYTQHDYDEWLVTRVEQILDVDSGGLGIGSAALLRKGAQAFVQVEVPDTMTTPEGVGFRPYLGACTSLDGSLATTYKRGVTVWQCDNTMAAGLREHGQVYKVKHSRNSLVKLGEARDALALVFETGDDFMKEVAELTSVKVSDGDWNKFLDEIAPLQKEDGTPKEGRGLTTVTRLRDEMNDLWLNDERVAPWKGTAWGVIAAVNTHTHHLQTVRGKSRPERNMEKTMYGHYDNLDADTYTVLQKLIA